MYRLFCPKGIFFKICVLSQSIVYWIHFQFINTFTCKKKTLVSGNAGDKKNLHPGGRNFFSPFSGGSLFSSLASFVYFSFFFLFFDSYVFLVVQKTLLHTLLLFVFKVFNLFLRQNVAGKKAGLYVQCWNQIQILRGYLNYFISIMNNTTF